jgi:hypothetical protein
VSVRLSAAESESARRCAKELFGAWRAATKAAGARALRSFRVGVVGFSAQPFDEALARAWMAEALDALAALAPDPAARGALTLVTGLTDVGMNAIAHRLARERGHALASVSSLAALEWPCFGVERAHLVGERWGEESEAFVGSLDAFLRVGGGPQSVREEAMARARGLPTWAFDLPPAAAAAKR